MRPTWMSSGPSRPCADPARTINYTMWESTRIHPDAVRQCNRLLAVVVPCEAVADWFRASGVTTPIRVVPLAIPTEIFQPGERFDSKRPPGPIRFGCAGRTMHGGIRKGLDLVIRAFLEAFAVGDGPSATLDVKCWPDCIVQDPGDPRVRILRAPLSKAGLADWYRSLDFFASASRGEGWGFHPHEAMACGVPAIAPHWGGHRAFMDAGNSYPVDWDERPAEGPIYGGLGDWCVIRPASLVDQMRRAAADLDDARARGRRAAARAAEFTWERTGREILAVLDEFAA